MDFSDYIKMEKTKAKRRETIIKIADLMMIHETTVYRWARGEKIPSDKKRVALSKITGIPKEELFKEKENDIKQH